MVPVFGEVCDATNAVIYLMEGNLGEAAMSGAACIPGWGNVATAAKWAGIVTGGATADAAKAYDKMKDAGNGLDGIHDAQKAADKAGTAGKTAKKAAGAGGKGGLNSINKLDDLLVDPSKLAGVSGNELYEYLLKNGYDVNPLSKGSYKGIPFEEGGGFKVNWGGDRILQYHRIGAGKWI
ncbi:MAG: hypothetical protein J6J42_04865 [Lachnospiraceae bacterium]|nr:hypothetical protein [Lachnospiraceae bacterium]